MFRASSALHPSEVAVLRQHTTGKASAGIGLKAYTDLRKETQAIGSPECYQTDYLCTLDVPYLLTVWSWVLLVSLHHRLLHLTSFEAPTRPWSGNCIHSVPITRTWPEHAFELSVMNAQDRGDAAPVQVFVHALMVFRYIERAQDKLQVAGPYLLWERQYKMVKVLVAFFP